MRVSGVSLNQYLSIDKNTMRRTRRIRIVSAICRALGSLHSIQCDKQMAIVSLHDAHSIQRIETNIAFSIEYFACAVIKSNMRNDNREEERERDKNQANYLFMSTRDPQSAHPLHLCITATESK